MATSFAAGLQTAADRDRSQTGILADVVERTVHAYNLQLACPPLENYRLTQPYGWGRSGVNFCAFNAFPQAHLRP